MNYDITRKKMLLYLRERTYYLFIKNEYSLSQDY